VVVHLNHRYHRLEIEQGTVPRRLIKLSLIIVYKDEPQTQDQQIMSQNHKTFKMSLIQLCEDSAGQQVNISEIFLRKEENSV